MNTIRPWTMEDAPALAAALNNKKIQDNLRDGLPLPYTLADAESYITAVLEADPGENFAWAVQDEEGLAVGSIGVTRKENVHHLTAELGYYLAEPYWGKGFVTRAVQEACDWMFENTDILRIFAEPYAQNEASCRVLEKAGFELEGTLRKNAVKNGRVVDCKMYALVR